MPEPSPSRNPRRRSWRPRFGLRTLFVLVTVTGITAAWFGNKVRIAQVEADIVQQIINEGGTVTYESLTEIGPVDLWMDAQLKRLLGKYWFYTVKTVTFGPGTSDETVGRIRELHDLGHVDFMDGDISSSKITEVVSIPHVQGISLNCMNGGVIEQAAVRSLAGSPNLKYVALRGPYFDETVLRELKGLSSIKELQLQSTKVKDIGREQARQFDGIEALCLDFSPISDAGMANIGQISSLELLSLGYTNITDQGIRHLQSLGKLKMLDLTGTVVTDQSVATLERLPSLEGVSILGTRITTKGRDRLKRNCPQCEIVGP